MKRQSHSKYCFHASSTLSRQGGLSLVELMIALVLSAIVVAALSEFFINISRSSQEMAKTNSQIENARFAMDFLREDIVHAGYWAGFLPQFDDLSNQDVPATVPGLVPNPCLPYADWDDLADAGETAIRNAMLGIVIQAHEAVPVGWSCGTLFADKVAGTDILVVRHANTCAVGDANCDAVVAGELYMQVPNCDGDIPPELYSLSTDESLLIGQDRECLVEQAPRKFVQTIYFVRSWANTVGDNSPALVRSRLQSIGGVPAHEPAQVLVEGIERFRVELGIDDTPAIGGAVNYGAAVDWADEEDWSTPTNRGDGVPDGDFIHCEPDCTAAQLRDVVAVKLYLLARANESTRGYVDTKDYVLGGANVAAASLVDDYKRHVFSTTVKLNNVSGRRETPFDPAEVLP
jgi:type IV pilus assembly protein PilW